MKRIKLTSNILSVRDFENGVEGFLGEVQPLTKNSGDQVTGSYGQNLYTVELLDLVTREVKKYWCDGGMRGALTLAKVQPATPIAIVHTGETTMDLDNGQKGKVQTYDIFRLEA